MTDFNSFNSINYDFGFNYTTSGTLNYNITTSGVVTYTMTLGEVNYSRSNPVVVNLKNCPTAIGDYPSIIYSAYDYSVYVSPHNEAINNLWKYNIKLNTWHSIQETPYTVDNGHLISFGKYIYFIEGSSGQDNRLLRYDIETDTWVSLNDRPTVESSNERVVLSATCDNVNYIYIFVRVAYDDTKIYRYSIAEDAWELYLRYSDVRISDTGSVSILVDDDYIYNVVDHGVVVSGSEYIVDSLLDGIYVNPLIRDVYTEDVPSSFVEPPTYRQTTPPDGWEQPYFKLHTNILDSPSTWNPPPSTPGLETTQPIDWLEPLSEDNKQVVPSGVESIADGPPTVQVPYAYQIGLINKTGNTVINDTNELYVWGDGALNETVAVNLKNSVVFEITNGECYNCRLTAWDDITHSSLTNEMLMTDRCRVTASAFSCYSASGDPYNPDSLYEFIFKPVVNQKLKGNIYYYGDFDLTYKYQNNVFGDYLIFMPYLADVDESITYGIHDFLITLHYSYT
jgi:hypothetical protein